MGFVNYKIGTQANYDALQTKNPDTLYFIEDEGKIIKNGVEYGGGNMDELTLLIGDVNSLLDILINGGDIGEILDEVNGEVI